MFSAKSAPVSGTIPTAPSWRVLAQAVSSQSSSRSRLRAWIAWSGISRASVAIRSRFVDTWLGPSRSQMFPSSVSRSRFSLSWGGSSRV